jgi:hypothetical protein
MGTTWARPLPELSLDSSRQGFTPPQNGGEADEQDGEVLQSVYDPELSEV